MKPEACAIDLDNCISDDKWRWCLFELDQPIINDRYQRYHEACHADYYRNDDVIRRLHAKYGNLIVFTSRPESVRAKTESWLLMHNVPVTRVMMRPNDNHEGSVIIKHQMLVEARADYTINGAIDDRIDILDMYADAGVRYCQHVQINSPEFTHP